MVIFTEIKRNKLGQFAKGVKNSCWSAKSGFQKGSIPWNKGRKDVYSEKTLQEMREVNKRNMTQGVKDKISKAKIGCKKSPNAYSFPIGEEHPSWKGGKSSENRKIRRRVEFRLWREAVYARDSWICQKCKAEGGRLHPHHIQNFADFPELRFAIDNGITFCKDCHWEFHSKYGYRNNTREQLEEFLKDTRIE